MLSDDNSFLPPEGSLVGPESGLSPLLRAGFGLRACFGPLLGGEEAPPGEQRSEKGSRSPLFSLFLPLVDRVGEERDQSPRESPSLNLAPEQ